MENLYNLVDWLMIFSNDKNQNKVNEYKMERMTKIEKPKPKLKPKPIIDKDEYKKNIAIIKNALETTKNETTKNETTELEKIHLKKINGKVTCPCTKYQREYTRTYWYEHIKSKQHCKYELENNAKLIMV